MIPFDKIIRHDDIYAPLQNRRFYVVVVVARVADTAWRIPVLGAIGAGGSSDDDHLGVNVRTAPLSRSADGRKTSYLPPTAGR